MKKLRIYVDTSVFGGTEDDEFREPSRKFFEQAKQGKFVVLVSQEVADEIGQAPLQVQQVLFGLPAEVVERVDVNKEVESLAAAYLKAGALAKSSESDAIHVAAATVAGDDLIVSLNFKHIVNFNRIRVFNAVNALERYKALDIRSPLEVVYDEEN